MSASQTTNACPTLKHTRVLSPLHIQLSGCVCTCRHSLSLQLEKFQSAPASDPVSQRGGDGAVNAPDGPMTRQRTIIYVRHFSWAAAGRTSSYRGSSLKEDYVLFGGLTPPTGDGDPQRGGVSTMVGGKGLQMGTRARRPSFGRCVCVLASSCV